MNLKHPYEKHLAEKLVHLPPPGDPDQNWQQMKSLLDKEMPRGGGGILGASRWLIPGIIIIAICTGVWFGGKRFLPIDRDDTSMAGTINKTKNNKAAENKPVAETATGSGTTPVAPANQTATTVAPANSQNNPAVAAAETNTIAPAETNREELVAGTVPPASVHDGKEKHSTSGLLPVKPVKSGKSDRSRNETNPMAVAASMNTVQPETTSQTNSKKTKADKKKIYAKKNASRKNESRQSEQMETEVVAEVTPEEAEDEATHFVSLPSVRVPKPPIRPVTKAGVRESPVDIIVDYTGSAVIVPAGALQRNYTYYSQADLFPELVAQKHNKRKSGRAYEGREDRAFAIGLSLPLGFPLGDQEPLAYNRQAGANTISDYIPSPHIQYHINSRTYFQTQVQLSSPQFIRPILLYQNMELAPQPNTFIYHSIYARKLYYFNLPVSVYHSPMRNFYMGTGLQFSSMLSGVALFEERKRSSMVGPPQDYILSQKYARFANDSLSHRFNGNEVRLLLDVNYYWNRFIVGLQYNQAFNNFVSFQVNGVSPYTFDKNKSLQFYLRYNIWEDRKRNRKSETMLSLK